MKNYLPVLIIYLISFAYTQTGLFVDKNTSAYSVWGTYEAFIDCEYCKEHKSFSFAYLTPYNLEFSLSRNILFNSDSENDIRYNKFGLNYYLDIKGSKTGIGYSYADILDHGDYSLERGTISLFSKFNDGLAIQLSVITDDESDCYYSSWYPGYYYCDNYSNTYEVISITKLFEINSYVIAIGYNNSADEDFFEFDYGKFSLSIGSIFK